LFSISQFEKHLKTGGRSCSKRTVSNYLDYLEEAFFIITKEKFSYSSRRRKMNPKKAYLMDTGFAALGRPFSENRGRILENLVAVELYRRGEETYYYRGRHECDFLVVRGHAPHRALQVCWELNARNEKRELAGLLEARRKLNVQSGTILTFSQEGRRSVNDWEMNVLPVWKWLINVEADKPD
jgi:predicted AAA+ superfamily ATPase